MFRSELNDSGWDSLDFIIISGDAYVDHPSFGAAIIGRVLESEGFRVGIIAQPNWRHIEDFRRLGRPNLAFLVTAGNIDSMVNHYTVAKKKRRGDLYSPGGKDGMRPDRASIVYANKAREAFKDVPIILGGIEASLRRLAHYDYWDDKVRRSILLDAKADLVIYGMAEQSIRQVAKALEQGRPIERIQEIRGTVFRTQEQTPEPEETVLPSYEAICADKRAFARSFQLQQENTDAIYGTRLWEDYGDFFVVQNPPAHPLSQEQLDAVYALPYTRQYHPSYTAQGGIPALDEVKFSLISNRGCFGGCSFCALTFHQGRVLQARSHESLVAEAETMIEFPDFKGNIHDVGGPTANFRRPACRKQLKHGVCRRKACLGTEPCSQLEVDHKDYVKLLRRLRGLKGVKNVFVRSGIRYDYVMYDKNQQFLPELVQHHVSGQLKVAPEHISDNVLHYMGKPGRDVYDRFVRAYKKCNQRLGKKQFLIPYFMSSHPGSTLNDAVELAEYIRDTGQMPEQVQDFYPTPGTSATCMYYTELDPRTMEPVYVPKDMHEKAMQRALIHYNRPTNRKLVLEALETVGRQDLIGSGPKALVRHNGPAHRKRTGPGAQPGKKRDRRSNKTRGRRR